MYIKSLLFILFLSYFTSAFSFSPDSKIQVLESQNTFVIDDFEEENAWVVKYSQFRKRNWKKHATNKNFYEESKKWLKWVDITTHPDLKILHYEISNNNILSEKQKKILSIKTSWEYKSQFEWIALEPNNTRPSRDFIPSKLHIIADSKTYKPRYQEWDVNKPNYIWLPTNTKSLHVYVWSGNYDYDLKVELQDTKGRNYKINMGNLNYSGWRILSASLPTSLYKSQSLKTFPQNQNIKFIRFLIENHKKNISSNHFLTSTAYFYLDYFYASVNEVDKMFSSYDLQFYNQIWEKDNPNPNTQKINANANEEGNPQENNN